MVFKIGTIDISRLILPPEITDTFRSQSVNYTLNGSLIVDRISELTKKKITVQIPLITQKQWNEIRAVIKPISFEISVDSAVYKVHLDGDMPTPVLYAGENEVMCGDISLTFEEM